MQIFGGGDSNAGYRSKAEFTVTIPKPKDSLLSMKRLAHPPYNFDFSSYDFHLLTKIKEILRGKWFTDAEGALAAYEKTVKATPMCEWAKYSSKWFHRVQ
ncbi:hypothetical protein EVAR_26516_1 [Eumeta japonica]|uniref:Mariner Mos1 transposase n=1 Tax=Eumeta variegata TaxID=151549 RepID=A0A4C1VBE0_EUMVA|nr:hypothetical protein EVAR_26516_1 [Eumeta japonica]